MITLTNGGITVSVTNPIDADWYMRAGYKKVEEPVDEAGSEQSETISITQIYSMCDKAGVDPDKLLLDEHPTHAQVKAAIRAAKKEVNNGL